MDSLQHGKRKYVAEAVDAHAEMETFIENKGKTFNDGLGSKWKLWRRRRYVVVIIFFLGKMVKAILRSNLSIAIFPMTENHTAINVNGTEIHVQDFDWDVTMRGFLLSVFYYGYILTNIPGGILAVKCGGTTVFGFGILLTSVTTLFTPVAARIHLYLLIFLRIFEGMCEGMLEPSMELLLSRWIPVEERSLVLSVVLSGAAWGHSTSFAVCSVIGFHWGWEAIFYFTGAVGVVLFLASLILVKEYPTLDKKMQRSELEYIQNSSKGISQSNGKVSTIPYVKIVTSMPVWAILLSEISNGWTFSMLLTQSPAYIKDILKLEYYDSGYLSSVPLFLKVLASYLMSPLADILAVKNVLTFTAARKIYVCLGLLLMAIFGFLIQQANSTALVLVCLTIMLIGGEVSHVQSVVNMLDIAPRYSSVIMGLAATGFSFCGMLAPTVTGYLTQNKTAEEWQIVFSIQAGICLLGAVIFGVFASGQLQPWAAERNHVTHEDVMDATR